MKLSEIQQKLKAPKNQRNNFGNYNYRNCEDILEALKPLLGDSIVTISDDIVQVGDRFYVKATATFTSFDKNGEKHEVTAFARESLDKKGMDVAQITGAASSYARKYALNGLFLIDDTKDADTEENGSTGHLKPFTVKRTVAAADDEAGGAVMKEDVSDEVEQIQRDGIKEIMKQLKKPLTKKAIKEITKMDYEPKNYDAIYKKLKVELEKTDPLEAAFPSDE